MAPTPKTTPQQVRTYLQKRWQSKAPIPNNDEIRRQLGWPISDKNFPR